MEKWSHLVIAIRVDWALKKKKSSESESEIKILKLLNQAWIIWFSYFLSCQVGEFHIKNYFYPVASPKYPFLCLGHVLDKFSQFGSLRCVASDLQGVRTNAKKDGDDWILNGSKVFITNGYMSGVVLVVAVTDPQAKSAAHGISLFLVEDGMPGFKKGRKLDKIGLKAQVILDTALCLSVCLCLSVSLSLRLSLSL